MDTKIANLYKLIRKVPNSTMLAKALPIYLAKVEEAIALNAITEVKSVYEELIHWVKEVKDLSDKILTEEQTQLVADTIEAMAEHYKVLATNVLVIKQPDEYEPLGDLIHPIYKLEFLLASGVASMQTIAEAHAVLNLEPTMKDDIYLDRSIELLTEVINKHAIKENACSEDTDFVPDVSFQLLFNRSLMYA